MNSWEPQTNNETLQRLSLVFEHSHDAILIVDPDADRILEANPRACEMLGYSGEELLRLPISSIHAHDMDRVAGFVERVQEKGHGWTGELACRCKNGTLLRTEMSASVARMNGRACLIAMVRDVSERERLREHARTLESDLSSRARHDAKFIFDSPSMHGVMRQVEKVAATNTSVLITGETGTGKERVATRIHELSLRQNEPLVRVDCASIPHDLFESEFFGHVRGAFTGAVADRIGRFESATGGTIFLDEIGEIPLATQSKLLRVLQEGTVERVGDSLPRRVDVRVIAATNRDLIAESEAGRFRQDLYYRICVFPIQLPPLRERVADIPALVHQCLEDACARASKPVPRVTPGSMARLTSYTWPGNIRELQNVIERWVIGSWKNVAEIDPPTASAIATGAQRTLRDIKREEETLIRQTLTMCNWKIYGDDGAAARLGVPPTTLASRVKKLGILRPRSPQPPA